MSRFILRRPRVVRVPAALMTTAVLLLAACSGSDTDNDASALSMSVVENPTNPLGARLDIEGLGADATIAYTATSDDHSIAADDVARTADGSFPVLGLLADHDYTIRVTADGSAAGSADWTTDPLPDPFPDITATVESDRERGPTLFNLMYWAAEDADSDGDNGDPPMVGLLAMVDGEGRPVWLYRSETQITDVRLTNRSTLLMSVDDLSAREIDLGGNTIADWHGRQAAALGPDLAGRPRVQPDSVLVETDAMHHEVGERRNGDLLVLSTELLDLPKGAGERLCAGEQVVPDKVIGDVIAQFDRSGKVSRSISVAEIFPPADHPGTELCREPNPIAPPTYFYPGSNGVDWSHGNAVVADEANNALIVSLRHLSTVFAVRDTDDAGGRAGSLLWTFGPQGDITLENGTMPSYQHAPEVLDDGGLLLYDNGNLHEPQISRAVIYDIDPDAGTATQRWESLGSGADEYAAFLGDADTTDEGTILITNGAISGPTPAVRGQETPLHARLVEIAPNLDTGDGGEVVFDLSVDGASGDGWTVYRAERLGPVIPTASE